MLRAETVVQLCSFLLGFSPAALPPSPQRWAYSSRQAPSMP
jgi:hypothetical protein